MNGVYFEFLFPIVFGGLLYVSMAHSMSTYLYSLACWEDLINLEDIRRMGCLNSVCRRTFATAKVALPCLDCGRALILVNINHLSCRHGQGGFTVP